MKRTVKISGDLLEWIDLLNHWTDDGTQTTHGQIGMPVYYGNHNDAYPWIKGTAAAAGVKF